MQQAHVRPTIKESNNKFFSMYYPAVGTGQYWIWVQMSTPHQFFVLMKEENIVPLRNNVK